MAYARHKVEYDRSPNLSDMARSSLNYYTSISYITQLNDQLNWRNALSYEKNSADGDAMSFNGYGYKTSLIGKVWEGVFSTNLFYENRSYKGKINVENLPNVKSKDNRYGVNANFASGLFGYKSLIGTISMGYEKQSSNIRFYSYSQPSITVGAIITF